MRNIPIGVGVLIVVLGAVLLFSKQGANQPQTTPVTPTATIMEPTSIATPSSEATPAAMMEKGTKEITVVGTDFSFAPAALSFKQGDSVKLTFKNQGKFPHNLTISDLHVATKTILPGESDTTAFTVDKAGTYSFICTVDAHADRGMKGSLTVQ